MVMTTYSAISPISFSILHGTSTPGIVILVGTPFLRILATPGLVVRNPDYFRATKPQAKNGLSSNSLKGISRENHIREFYVYQCSTGRIGVRIRGSQNQKESTA